MKLRLLALALLGLTGFMATGTDAATPAPHPAPAQVERGRYLARVGDCIACHTAKGGAPYAGGLAIETGFGAIYSPNITPDRETGIGQWSESDFYGALHAGHDDEGKHLYPAFPYPWFTKVTRDDVDAIKDYLDSLAPVHQENKPLDLAWWMRWRASVAGWNLIWFDEGTFQADPDKSTEWNRGAYLVEGLGHCGDCHSPKSFFGGVKHDGNALSGGYTKGGHANGWFAPSLRGEAQAGLGRWSVADIAQYLKTGANAYTAAAGPMAEAVSRSTSFYSDGDLTAVAVYLKSLAPGRAELPVQAIEAQSLARGEALFVDHCAACHMHDGAGLPNVFPALMGSSAIQAREPATLLHIVLAGAAIPGAHGQRSAIAMPGFAHKLDDGEVADLVSYIRNAWGNRGSAVDAGAVAKVRTAIGTTSATH
ncbi:MAG: cytochrome c [Caldimonas sp.]